MYQALDSEMWTLDSEMDQTLNSEMDQTLNSEMYQTLDSDIKIIPSD